MILRKKDEVLEALPSQRSHEALDAGARIRCPVWNGDAANVNYRFEPSVQGTSMLAALASTVLSENAVVVMNEIAGSFVPCGRFADLLFHPIQRR